MKLLEVIFESVVDMYEGRKLTQQEFIDRARKVFKDRYVYIPRKLTIDGKKIDYSGVTYTGSNNYVQILCLKHGIFEKRPNDHLSGAGCQTCAKEKLTLTLDEFIKKAKKVHGNKYIYTPKNLTIDGKEVNYKGVKYVRNDIDIEILCPRHGIFKNTPHEHTSLGYGCRKCYDQDRTTTIEEFIKQAKEVHGNKYIYTPKKLTIDGKEVNYKGVKPDSNYIKRDEDAFILCPRHGVFKNRSSHHLEGSGCKQCFNEDRSTTIEEFIKKAKKVHGNKYIYTPIELTIDGKKIDYKGVKPGSNYILTKELAYILCPKHGIFPQNVNGHINRGDGCPTCAEKKGETYTQEILKNLKIKSKRQHKFTDCISYKAKNKKIIKNCDLLRYDFYLPSKNILIEFDGEYHFYKRNRSDEDFISQIRNDRMKNRYAKKNNIKLIRIGYKDFINLKEEIKKGLVSNEQMYLSTNYPKNLGWRNKLIK